MEILLVNYEDRTVHASMGTHPFLTQDEFTKMITEAKRQISNRSNPLERFEFWEIPDKDQRKIALLLMGRARNREEKDLITRYRNS